MPKVSVIIPVYNAGKYLRECLDSVVNQTLKDIEIICVNDASTDDSKEILLKYKENDKRIKLICYEANKTASQARKDGVMLATGEYIMFMDADDSLELDACERLVALMQVHQVDILQFGTFVDAESTVKSSSIYFFTNFVEPYNNYLYDRDVFEGCFQEKKYRFNLWNKIYTSELCKKAFSEVEDGAFPKAQDLYAFFILAWYAKSYYGIDEQYYHYNYGRGITGRARKKTTIAEFERHCSENKVAEKCRDFLVAHGAWQIYEGAWNDLNLGLVAECVSHWVNDVDDVDGAEGFDILIKHWKAADILTILKRDYKDEFDYINNKARLYPNLEGKSIFEFLDELELRQIVDKEDAEIPCGFQKVVPIVLATNDSYLPYAGVTIQSIIDNSMSENYYRIYILYDNLSKYHIEAVENMSTGNIVIKCIDVGMLIEKKEATLYERAHYSKETYYRFLIPDIFYFYKNVIYLDCDLVVLEDVAKMLDNDLGTNLVAAVRNYTLPDADKRLKRDFFINGEQYFNAGVLIINIDLWKKERIVDRCFELLKTIPKEKLLFCDQDILNIVCKDRVLYLNLAWNFYWHMIYGKDEFIKLCSYEVRQLENQYKILHFASKIKPWSSPELPLSKYFWHYARKTYFYEEILMNNIFINENRGNRNSKVEDKLERNNKGSKTEAKAASQSTQFAVRKIYGGIQCYRDHGFTYTFKRTLEHLGIPMGIELKKKEKMIIDLALVKKVKRYYQYHGLKKTCKKIFEKIRGK